MYTYWEELVILFRSVLTRNYSFYFPISNLIYLHVFFLYIQLFSAKEQTVVLHVVSGELFITRTR